MYVITDGDSADVHLCMVRKNTGKKLHKVMLCNVSYLSVEHLSAKACGCSYFLLRSRSVLSTIDV